MRTPSKRKVYSDILLSKYESNVKKAFDDKNRIKKFLVHIHKYIDKNSEVLTYPAPTKRLPFATNGLDAKIVFETIGIDPREMQKVINSIHRAAKKSAVLKTPLAVSLALLLREADLRGLKNEREAIMMYMVFSFYWSIQFRQIRYEPPEAAVMYTINTLSNKSYFKSNGTLYNALLLTAENNHENGIKYLESRDDDDIISYIMDMRTRISSLIVRFTSILLKNVNDKLYLNSVADNYDDNYYEVESVSTAITKYTNKATIYFFQNRIDPKMINLSGKINQVPVNKLSYILDNIKSEDQSRVESLIRSIITVYLKDNHPIDTLGTTKFLKESLKFFSKSNSYDKDVKFIKDELEYYLNKYSETYLKTNRADTKKSYRRSIYTYFVLHIIYSVNN